MVDCRTVSLLLPYLLCKIFQLSVSYAPKSAQEAINGLVCLAFANSLLHLVLQVLTKYLDFGILA